MNARRHIRSRSPASDPGLRGDPLVSLPRPWRALALALGFAAPLLLLLWSLESAPGLDGDEAWVALATHHIAFLGERPLYGINGMNGYTGSLHLYVLAAVVRLFGEGLVVFRGVSAFLGVVFVLATVSVARALTRKAPGSAWAGVLVASSPLVLLEARYTTELTSFVPAMLMGGLALCLSAIDRPRRWGLPLAGAGGLLAGLACYLHGLAAIFLVAAAVGAVAALRARAFLHPVAWAAAGGVVAGVVPRLLHLAQAIESFRSNTSFFGQTGSRAADLPSVLPVLAGVLDGRLVYLRFTGQELVTVIPYVSLAIGAVVVLRALAARGPLDRAERALLAGAVASLVATVAIAPALAVRYFSFTVWSVQLWLFVTVLRVRQRASPRLGRLAAGLLGTVIVCNLVYVTVNFHVAFARTGGRPAVIPLGTRFLETSDHFMRTDRLYRELTGRGIRGAAAEEFIATPLAYYEQQERRGLALGVLPVERFPPPDRLPHDDGLALVYYEGPDRFPPPPAFVHGDEVQVGELLFRRDPSFDPNFRVFLSPVAWRRVRSEGEGVSAPAAATQP